MAKTIRSEAKKPKNMVLRLLGPGLVTGAADDDPSGIATYSQAGAKFGYGLLWTVFLTTPFMIAIQLVSAQIGRVTGKGVAANAMQLAPRWVILGLVFLLVAANTFNIAADIAAMAEALSLVIGGLNHEHALIFAAASTLLEVFVPYRRYAPVLKFLTLALFAYVATAFTVKIPWGTALLATVWPKAHINADYFLMVVAVLGTTNINAATQAAEALRPLAGDATFALFALGIVGTGLLAIPVLASSAAYGVSEVFGWHATLEARAPDAVGFYSIIAAATVIGFGLGFTGIDAIHMLVWSAVLNGTVAVPIMAMMMAIVPNPRLMGRFKATSRLIALGWIGTGLMALAVIELFWSFFAG